MTYPPYIQGLYSVVVLGFGVDEVNRILDYLYPALANKIQQTEKLVQK